MIRRKWLRPRAKKKKPNRQGTTLQILVVVGWVWMLGFIGVITWYLREGQQSRRHGASSGSLLEVGNLGRIPAGRGNTREVSTHDDPPLPQTGLKHVPELLPLSTDPTAYLSPLLIFTFRRANYLSQTLDDILENESDHCGFGCPIVVSEDGSHEEISQVVQVYLDKFAARGIPLIHLQHTQLEVAPTKKAMLRKRPNPADAYKALAQHYGWALTQVFNGLDPAIPQPDRVIILEEDIHTSPDFFSYMEATAKVLDEDPTLLAVSAYNDNGHMVQDPKRLLRSDFFPGLGWMMTRKLWKEEMEAKWPDAYWDDWLREPDQRKNRQIIRPEVSRTFHFGAKGGTSNNQFGLILGQIKLNREAVEWSTQDLSYLRESAYDAQYSTLIAGSTKVASLQEARTKIKTADVWLEYKDFAEFRDFARLLKIMDDEKATIPRTAYKGIIEVRPEGEHILFLTPPIDTLRRSFPNLS